MTFYDEPMLQGDYEDIADYPTSLGNYLAAKFSSGFDTTRGVFQGVETANARYPAPDQEALLRTLREEPDWSAIGGALPGPQPLPTTPPQPPLARIPMEEAKRRIKEAHLEHEITNLGDAPDIPSAALDVMMRHAQERRYREAQIARGPSGIVPGVLGVGVEFLGSALDPLNVAAFSMPLVGEVRKL